MGSKRGGGGNREQMVRWTTLQVVEAQRRILRENGQDPALVPDEKFRFIDLKEVKARLGVGTTTVYRAMAAGKFPRPVKFDGLTTPATPATSEAA
jgi:hypothetical protein